MKYDDIFAMAYQPPTHLCSYDAGADGSNQGGGAADGFGGGGDPGSADNGGSFDLSGDPNSFGGAPAMGFSTDTQANLGDVTTAIGAVGLAGMAAANPSSGLAVAGAGFGLAAGMQAIGNAAVELSSDMQIGISNLGQEVTSNPGGFGGFATTTGDFTDTSGNSGFGGGGFSTYDQGQGG